MVLGVAGVLTDVPPIAFNIFNGTINGSTVVTSPISHN
jgi:hypothetical protein